MLDRKIPFYNVIMKCSSYIKNEILLNNDFEIRFFQKGDEDAWAELEYEIGDFDSYDEAKSYFINTYLEQNIYTSDRMFFAVEKESNKIVGSVIAGNDMRGNEKVASLQWLIVSPAYQEKGIGKALFQKAMNMFTEKGEMPVYIHTQPWSHKAIMLYDKYGFKMQKEDTFSHYLNQYNEAMMTLKRVLSMNDYELISNNSE